MASRNFNRAQALNKEVKVIAGRFTHSAKSKGLGYSVANTATGQYTVTLQDSYPHLLAAQAMVQAAGGSDDNVILVSHDVTAATPTLVFEHQAAGAAADLSGSEEIHFTLFLQNSTLPAV